MLCDISQGGVRYDSDSLYALVMISNKAKLVDHCSKTLPSRERRGFDDETGQTTGCLDVRVDRLREFHKVVLLDRRLWLHVQDGMLGIEVVFDHVSLLYDRCGPRPALADGVGAHVPAANPYRLHPTASTPRGSRDRSPHVRSHSSCCGCRLSGLGNPAVAIEDRIHRRLLPEGCAKVCTGG